MTAWGANGGADKVVKNLRGKLRGRGHEVGIIYRFLPEQECGIAMHSGREAYYRSPEDLFKSVGSYDILNMHASNLLGRDIEAVYSPIVYQTHGLLIHEVLNRGDEKSRAYKGYVESLPEKERSQTVRKALREKDPKRFLEAQEAAFEKATVLTNMTGWGDRLLKSWYPEYGRKGIVIPNGSDAYKLDKERGVDRRAHEIRRSAGKPIILYAGRIIPEKGVRELTRAFEGLRRKGCDAKLLLVGAGDKDLVFPNLSETYKADVEIRGWVEDDRELAAHYKAASAVAIPSYHESFCLTALEAGMLGTPVVLSDVDGAGEAFVKPLFAYGARPGDTAGLEQRLEWILRNPRKAAGNATSVKKRLVEKFNLDRITDATLGSYYGALLKQYGHGPTMQYGAVAERCGVSEDEVLEKLSALDSVRKS
jgi:glycosyltransferase involved in cell wall biosynthesis